MNFFLLTEDSDFIHSPKIIGRFDELDDISFYEDQFYKIPQQSYLRVKDAPFIESKSILFMPYPFIDDVVKDAITLHETSIIFKEYILANSNNSFHHTYYIPFLKRIHIEKVEDATYYIKPENYLDSHVFYLREERDFYLVVTLDFLEYILSKGAYGFTVKEIEIRRSEINGK